MKNLFQPLYTYGHHACLYTEVFLIYIIIMTIQYTDRFIKDCYEVVKGLFSLDPLLVFNVGYICPSSDVAELCKHLYLPYAISLVSMKIQSFKKQISKAEDVEAS